LIKQLKIAQPALGYFHPNAVKQIQRTNQRYKAKGTYLLEEELVETLQDAYELAFERAALEAFDAKLRNLEKWWSKHKS